MRKRSWTALQSWQRPRSVPWREELRGGPSEGSQLGREVPSHRPAPLTSHWIWPPLRRRGHGPEGGGSLWLGIVPREGQSPLHHRGSENLSPCITYLLLSNKLPLTWHFKTTNIHYLPVFMGPWPGPSLMGSSGLGPTGCNQYWVCCDFIWSPSDNNAFKVIRWQNSCPYGCMTVGLAFC